MRSYRCLNNKCWESNGFSITTIREQDKYFIMKWRNEQLYHLRQNKPLTIEDQENYFKNTIDKLFEKERPEQILFSFLKAGTCIGYGGLVHINWIDKNAEVSFVMDTTLEDDHFDELWSKYLELIEQVAFRDLNLHKIFTYAFDLRPRLYPLLIDNGFEHEATLKEHCEFDGGFKNVLIHSKIKSVPYLKKAQLTDTDIIYKWAIDPEIRKYSFDQKPIEYEKHVEWFKSKIKDDACLYYILRLGNNNLGSIRLDVNKEGIGLISYLIEPDLQGKGYGLLLLKKIENIIKGRSITKLVGSVLAENFASLKIFRKMGYSEHKREGKFEFIKEVEI